MTPRLKQGKAENKKMKYKPCFERKKEIPVLFEIENILLSSYKNWSNQLIFMVPASTCYHKYNNKMVNYKNNKTFAQTAA